MDSCILPMKPDILEKLNNVNLASNPPGLGFTDKASSEDINVPVGPDDFQALKLVGKLGGIGRVYQVRKVGSPEIYAMKVIPKDKIVERQRNILAKLDHPFIIHLRYSFQTEQKLYLVLDFINGGNLFFHLKKEVLFMEDTSRIYAAEIVSAISHLHANRILHGDLKPENVLLDAKGHAILMGFGFAEQFDDPKNTRISNPKPGTVLEYYMAPEVLQSRYYYGKAADWWSLGIILYELLTGDLPFFTENRHKLKSKILSANVRIPSDLSSEVHSLLKGLLEKDPTKRLGSGKRGSEEIKGHKWFGSINWNKLEAREIEQRFVPLVSGKGCVANFEYAKSIPSSLNIRKLTS